MLRRQVTAVRKNMEVIPLTEKNEISCVTNEDWKERLLPFILELSASNSNFSQQVLCLMAKHFGYQHLLFFPYKGVKQGGGSGKHRDLINNFISYNIDYHYLNEFAKHAYKNNIFSPSHLPQKLRLEKVITVNKLMSYEEFEKSEWCQNLQMSGGMYYHACIHLFNEARTEQVASINIFRTKEEGEFTEAETDMFEYLSDYLSNIFRLRLSWGGDQSLGSSVSGALKNLALGVIYLDEQMAVIEANAMAKQLCTQYLQDFDDLLVKRSAVYIDESNMCVQRVIDNLGTELLNAQPYYERSTAMGSRYTFYPSSFMSYGIVGILSNRYMIFLKKDEAFGKLRNEIHLTRREEEILKYILQGLSNGEISKELNVSIYTVRTHVFNLYQKFDVKSRAELLVKLK